MLLSTQHLHRNKYQKIRCPECNSLSKVTDVIFIGIEKRICKNGHKFFYCYILEAIHNLALNYKTKF